MTKIEAYLRTHCTDIISLLKKNKCEVCKSMDNLELHHIYEFEDIIIDAHKLLKLKREINKEDYTKENLQLLLFVIRGMHSLKNTVTVCNECHKKLYKEISMNKRLDRLSIKNNVSRILDIDKINNYLENLVNVKMFDKKQLEFVDFIKKNNARQINCRGSKIYPYSIQKWFDKNNLNYKIVSKKETKAINRNQTFWIIKNSTKPHSFS